MLHGRMLRYLDEVARAGSIRKAASRLNVAASAINRQIISLEAELETPIFERMPGGLRLTATGEILIAHVRDTMREHQRTLGRMAALKGLMRGEVVIATMGGLAASILAEVLGAFRAQHPRVKLVVRVLPRDAIIQAVLGGEADLGLAYNLPRHARMFRAMEVALPIGAVFAPTHPLAGRMSLRFADLVPFPLIMAERGMSLREAVDVLLPTTVDFTPAVETNSLELMKHLACEVPAVTFMSLIDVGEDLRRGRLAFVPFADSAAGQKVTLVHRFVGPLDPVISVVVRHVAAAFARHTAGD